MTMKTDRRLPAQAATRRPALSRPVIAEAALAIVDREGLSKLSMRRLGVALGVEAMAVYHHFAGKGEILDAVMERLLAEVEIDDALADPIERLRACIRSYRQVAVRHPNAFALLTNRRWLLGLLTVGLGASLHIVGLMLAPVTVVQPVGILAVPWAVLLAAKIHHFRPTKVI